MDSDFPGANPLACTGFPTQIPLQQPSSCPGSAALLYHSWSCCSSPEHWARFSNNQKYMVLMASGISGTNHWDNGRKNTKALLRALSHLVSATGHAPKLFVQSSTCTQMPPACWCCKLRVAEGWDGGIPPQELGVQAGRGGQGSPVCQPVSAGAGCAGSPRGGCPGVEGSSSCSVWCWAHLSCRASTGSTSGEEKTHQHLPWQRGTGLAQQSLPSPTSSPENHKTSAHP